MLLYERKNKIQVPSNEKKSASKDLMIPEGDTENIIKINVAYSRCLDISQPVTAEWYQLQGQKLCRC